MMSVIYQKVAFNNNSEDEDSDKFGDKATIANKKKPCATK
jgi:hypothetical protein